MVTVCYPASGKLTPAFAAVAKHYGVGADICPSRRGNRKGVVEKANHSAAQRWWRTVADDATIRSAQAILDQLCDRLDDRRRVVDGQRTTVADLAEDERLRPPPVAAFPAELEVERTVTPQGLVAFRGSTYSVPPGMAGSRVVVRHRLGASDLRIVTASGVTVAAHLRVTDGAGQVVRDAGHVVALERAAMAAFSHERPCSSKARRPPSPAALAEAAALRGLPSTGPAAHVVIDLSTYAATAAALGKTHTPIKEQE